MFKGNKPIVLLRQSRDTNRNMKKLVYCRYGSIVKSKPEQSPIFRVDIQD